jgi:peptide/nickel transport system permease protein
MLMNLEQALSQSKLYIYQDQKEQAREILVAILRENPDNAEAWILSAQVCDKLGQVLYCLQRASKLNPKILETHPNAPQIRALITRLQKPTSPAPATPGSGDPITIIAENKTNYPIASGVFSRTIKYLLVRVLTISITIFIGVFITVILADQGHQIDDSVHWEVEQELDRQFPGLSCYYCQPTPSQEAQIDAVRLKLQDAAGLHLPYLPRHLLWTLRALRMDIGNAVWIQGAPGSAFPSSRATDIVLSELPHSLLLVGTAFLFVFIFGIPLALILFRKNGSRLERLFAILAPVSSIPSWVLGIILVLIFAVQLHWLPPSGMFDPIPPGTDWAYFSTVVKHMVLPVLAIILSLFFQLVYSWKTLFLLNANEDYVDLAKAKGLSQTVIERRYILRPTLPYMITNLTLLMVSFWQMTIVLEYIFNWPGIGRLYILSLPNFFGENMFPGIMGIVVAIVVVFAYILGITVFVLDIVYGLVDPRVRVGGVEQTMRPVAAKRRISFRVRRRDEDRLSTEQVWTRQHALGQGVHEKVTVADREKSFAKACRSIKPFFRELRRYPSAIFGLLIILLLVVGSICAVVIYPYDQLGQLWDYSVLTGKSYVPKLASPVWVNWFRRDPLPSTIILDSRNGTASKTVQPYTAGGVGSITIDYVVNYPYGGYPQDLTLYFTNQYIQKQPFVTINWITPDGREINFGNFSPMSGMPYHLSDDPSLRKILPKYANWQKWFVVGGYQSTPDYYLLFSDPGQDKPVVIPGTYTMRINVMTFEEGTDVDAELVLLGKVSGWAGTDYMRRDLLVPLLWGMPFALALGLVGASVTTFFSMIVAAMAVWYGGWLDGLIQRLIEGIMILPVIAIGVIFYAYFNMSIWIFLGLIALLNVFGSPTKSFRAAFLQVKEAPYIEAAKAAGASDMRIIIHYLVPSIIPILIPQLITLIPSYVFLEATLGFFRVNSLYPTWGKVIYEALRHGSAYGSGYWVLEPISLLLLTGLAFAMLGFALERILNPRLRDL